MKAQGTLGDLVLIMDLDGTLVDSEAVNHSIILKMFRHLGYSDDKICTAMQKIASGADYDELVRFLELDKEMHIKMTQIMKSTAEKRQYTLFPNVSHTLKILSDEKVAMAIATDNYYASTNNIIKRIGISVFFDPEMIFSCDNFPYRKPAPDVASEIFRLSGRKAGIIIGNSRKDIVFASNCGLPAILFKCNSKWLEDDEHITNERTYIMQDWIELPSIISKIAGSD